MKNNIKSSLTVALAAVSLFFLGCEDDVSNIGSSITSSEVSIHVDSVVYDIHGRSVKAPSIESKSAFTLMGSVSIPEYGDLQCSYVTQFLPAESLDIPDSISGAEIDSVKMILSAPRNLVTGDTLVPQQLKVFSLTKQLPADINASFNPSGYYDPSTPIGTKNYSMRGMKFNDTTFLENSNVSIDVRMPIQLGREVVDTYHENPDVFVWPEKFSKLWPGVFVEPTFGRGCVYAVSSTKIFAYYPQSIAVAEKDEEGETQIVYKEIPDSVCLFTTAPEVLSSVNMTYTPSAKIENMVAEGKSVITTPGGYVTSIRFPAREVLEEYWGQEYELGVIDNLLFSIPAKPVTNGYGIGMPPSLLMVKSSEVDSFFAEGRVPDNITSFYSYYSTDDKGYSFSSMRRYIVNLRDKGEENITAEDEEFTLVPVSISTEEYTDRNTGEVVVAVTNVLPYIVKPTMVELDTQNAEIVFIFSNQKID